MQEWGQADTPEQAWVDAMNCLILISEGGHTCPSGPDEDCAQCDARASELLVQIGDACRDD
jgi:hypothetical protein